MTFVRRYGEERPQLPPLAEALHRQADTLWEASQILRDYDEYYLAVQVRKIETRVREQAQRAC